ncbi:MAG: hypothetical protein KDE14_11740 [Rhodobacteraceae bacterium]|nr:hypothetical protein [Paracoccaceae bacterium]
MARSSSSGSGQLCSFREWDTYLLVPSYLIGIRSYSAHIEPNAVNVVFQFNDLSIEEDLLSEARRKLYASDGDGFFIVRNFLNEAQLDHMRKVWTNPNVCANYLLLKDLTPEIIAKVGTGDDLSIFKPSTFLGAPNQFRIDERGNSNFVNFFWNEPSDEVTYTACLYAHTLRCRIEGRPPFEEIYTFSGNVAQFSVRRCVDAATVVRPHRDWISKNPLDKDSYQLQRLQITLFLSNKENDYLGTGFKFRKNTGEDVVFGTDVEVGAGDLVFWRYNNLHSVEQIKTRDGQIGFLRIVMPPEKVRPFVQINCVLSDGRDALGIATPKS